jgi:hypothetical protein
MENKRNKEKYLYRAQSRTPLNRIYDVEEIFRFQDPKKEI